MRRSALPPSACLLVCAIAACLSSTAGGGVRDQTRIVPRNATSANEGQASDVTLTLTDVAVRSIQSWIRTAGPLDTAGKTISVFVRSPDAQLLATGQRARVFTVSSRTQMQQARVSRIVSRSDGAQVEVTLAGQGRQTGALYLTEILVDRGQRLSVPNVSILEEENRHVVYVLTSPGEYVRRKIETGIQGELYTEVISGLQSGDQVVSIGSFFVDADLKLKSAGADETQ